MKRRIFYVIDLYDGTLVKAVGSDGAADRAAERHVRRTGHTCAVAQIGGGLRYIRSTP